MDEADRIAELAARALESAGPIVFLTGAGISAESGIPTFRGPEGYWRIGSRNYQPESLATRAAFEQMPEEIWAWYLYRRAVCRAARPNAAHLALVAIEKVLGERFLLVTQNVDGLHLRAGSSKERCYEIHGNIDFMRCEDEHPRLRPIPPSLPTDWPKTRKLGEADRAALACCGGGELARPHVLWFDESYDEELFRFESSMAAGAAAAMLVVIGTSGATTLPSHLVSLAVHRGIPLVVIGPDESPFTRAAYGCESGVVLKGTAGEWVPVIAHALGA
ncbi:MAG: Sir2 family NAD-dependent protein deacetylase [Sandaracinus sp.]